MNLYGLTEADLRWLKTNIAELREVVANRSRPGMESSWSDREDHQAPEVYIAYPQDQPETGTSTSTGAWSRPESIVIPGITLATTETDYDIIHSDKCDLYKIIYDGSDYVLKPVCGRDNKEECFRRVYNPTESAIANQYVLTIRDKYGNFMALPSSKLVKCMLAENHPGRHTPGDRTKEFDVWPGTWCPDQLCWKFNCDDPDELWTAVDDFNGGTSFTYPNKYAQGWFQIMSADPSLSLRDDIVYAAVTGDCESDDECTDWQLPCEPTGTATAT
jgi:hypothetical protein